VPLSIQADQARWRSGAHQMSLARSDEPGCSGNRIVRTRSVGMAGQGLLQLLAMAAARIGKHVHDLAALPLLQDLIRLDQGHIQPGEVAQSLFGQVAVAGQIEDPPEQEILPGGVDVDDLAAHGDLEQPGDRRRPHCVDRGGRVTLQEACPDIVRGIAEDRERQNERARNAMSLIPPPSSARYVDRSASPAGLGLPAGAHPGPCPW
jgi:hypothetical protein